MSLKVIFMGTPDFAVPTLKAVHQAGHSVVAVYSQPPRAAGRGMAQRNSPVHACAEELGLDVFTPLNFKNDEAVNAFLAHQADVAVVVAYGLILPQSVLSGPDHGCFNVHASRLPRWRGAAPIQRAIMAGDQGTAVSIMRMEAGLDTGPVCLTHEIGIDDATTAGALHDTLSAAGATLMVDALARLEQNTLVCVAQPDDGVSYASKIDKREARIDFTTTARSVVRHIHGLSPFPGAWFEVHNGKKSERIKVLTAQLASGKGTPGEVLDNNLTIACGDGAVQLLSVQRAGKKPVSADAFLRGFDLPKGSIIGGKPTS